MNDEKTYSINGGTVYYGTAPIGDVYKGGITWRRKLLAGSYTYPAEDLRKIADLLDEYNKVNKNDNQALYRENIIATIKGEKDYVLENNSEDNIVLILSEMIKSAKNTVHILCTSFSSLVYGNEEIQNCILEAISRGVKFTIGIRTSIPEAKGFYDILLERDCRVITDFNCERSDFCVVDGKSFRLEKEKHSREAFFCANWKDASMKLIRWFEISLERKNNKI